MIGTRTGSILKVLVDEYVDTATPVASEDIARRLPVKVSPATVRNEMANLEEGGYILRPHISAGGVPSDRGYRYYVEALDEVAEPPGYVRRSVREQFSKAQRDPELWVEMAAGVLARSARNMAIVTLPRIAAARIKYIQLVYLQKFLALLIIVLQEARLRQQLLPLEEPTTQDQLTEVASKLNDSLADLTHPEILSKQLELNPLEEMVRDDTISILRDVEAESAVGHSVEGLAILLGQPEFAETGRARELVEIIEDRVLLKSILAEAPDRGGVAVFIGGENMAEPLRPYSVVLSQYGIPNEAAGTIGVIGPTRMEYAGVMGSVRLLSSVMSDLVMGVHGRR